jgi:hypothetical protein
MNYLQEKKEILELKLKLTSILIEKKLCIRNQQYEKVADLRDEEKELLQLLENKAIEIKEHQQIFEEKIHTVEDRYLFLSLLNEISIYYTPYKQHEETIDDFYFKLRENYNKLIKLKDELSKMHQFKEANQVRNDLLDIGRFLSREKLSGKL